MEPLLDSETSLLKQQLLELRTMLLSQLEANSGAADTVTLDQSKVGRVSRMDAMQQQQMALSTRAKAKLRLQKVVAALNAIEQDEYGYCRRCDEDIGFPRLQAQPGTALCFNCQNHSDMQQ